MRDEEISSVTARISSVTYVKFINYYFSFCQSTFGGKDISDASVDETGRTKNYDDRNTILKSVTREI